MLPLARRTDMVAIEIGGMLLELGEILDRPQRTLRAVDLLVEHAAQTWRIEPKAGRPWPHIRRVMEGAIAVEIGMTIEAGNTPMLFSCLAILGLVEFLLRERREQKAQPLHLHRRDQSVHDLVMIGNRQQFAARHIA